MSRAAAVLSKINESNVEWYFEEYTLSEFAGYFDNEEGDSPYEQKLVSTLKSTLPSKFVMISSDDLGEDGDDKMYEKFAKGLTKTMKKVYTDSDIDSEIYTGTIDGKKAVMAVSGENYSMSIFCVSEFDIK